ncbi:hypothetical protein A3860_05755 [Niastella vici]|uniref:Uncharacterized protein n=1 Tax=Niastella vici TaxID=1703345 RepID=A0A1V9FSJ5_9BACT|nr:hypothetical protein [Niastella vici]OQP61216.1 hypothetical protein A3860_05755 [Niastella vici]
MAKRIFILVFFIAKAIMAGAQEWQWSVTVDSVVSPETNSFPRAFLWIPPNCKQVRGVVVGQHNMIEDGILEHPDFRKAMTALGFAEVWVTPNITIPFDFNKDAGADFNYMMQKLADSSGYAELAKAPVVPIGHSALASYPWNFAAWDPARTLAVISIHGDAPQTKLTGYGRPNVDWGNRTIEGVPGLFIMGEYEWWEDRIAPGFEYVRQHPKTPITFFADAGHGHFDYSDELVNYVALFIQKAAEYRLVAGAANLKFIDPANGWLMDRWRKDSVPTAAAARYKEYKGNRLHASWCFDAAQCAATEKYYATARAKQAQQIGFMQEGAVVAPSKSHANYTLKFEPLRDGITFHVKAFFADTSRMVATAQHATTPVHLNRITGPVMKINDSTFRLWFYRIGFNNPKRSNDVWLIATNAGDEKYKSIVQQANLRFPVKNTVGKMQQINFPSIPDQKINTKVIELNATSTAGVPVYYYVKDGPAALNGNRLTITKIPPRAKFPVKVTVVAWQYGSSVEPKLQSAEPIERSFYIFK